MPHTKLLVIFWIASLQSDPNDIFAYPWFLTHNTAHQSVSAFDFWAEFTLGITRAPTWPIIPWLSLKIQQPSFVYKMIQIPISTDITFKGMKILRKPNFRCILVDMDMFSSVSKNIWLCIQTYRDPHWLFEWCTKPRRVSH